MSVKKGGKAGDSGAGVRTADDEDDDAERRAENAEDPRALAPLSMVFDRSQPDISARSQWQLNIVDLSILFFLLWIMASYTRHIPQRSRMHLRIRCQLQVAHGRKDKR